MFNTPRARIEKGIIGGVSAKRFLPNLNVRRNGRSLCDADRRSAKREVQKATDDKVTTNLGSFMKSLRNSWPAVCHGKCGPVAETQIMATLHRLPGGAQDTRYLRYRHLGCRDNVSLARQIQGRAASLRIASGSSQSQGNVLLPFALFAPVLFTAVPVVLRLS